MNGILAIDKPENLTSFDVCAKIKRLTHAKVGHTGTLDPMATGVLLVCVGNATKLVPYLTTATKTYKATIDLGIQTDTGDITGQVIQQKPIQPVNKQQLTQIEQALLGAQEQQVPMYSAVSVNGKRLYQYARKQQDIERPIKPITIYELSFINHTSNQLTYKTTVSKGTYIRVLSETIAQMTSNIGTTSVLRRLSNGYIDVDQCQTLESVETKLNWINPLRLLSAYPQIEVDDPTTIYHGKQIQLNQQDPMVLFTHQQQPLAFYAHIGKGLYKSERGLW